MGELKGQVAVVTGGNSGIGKAIARELARQGAIVAIIGRNTEKNNAVVQDINSSGGQAVSYTADVSDFDAIGKVAEEIMSGLDIPSIVVHNAGNSTAPNTVDNMPLEDWSSLLNTHLTGAFNVAHHFLAKMKEKHYGRLIFTASVGGFLGLAGNSNYGAAKAGLLGLAKSLAKESGRDGITVNAVLPGVVATPMTAGPLSIPGMKESFTRETPTGCMVNADDVAYVVSCLASPRAKAINGAEIVIDGGYTLECGLDRVMYGALGKQV